jgi:2'-hydroxyisoflavone reductase
MRCLVVGGTGFLGGVIADALVKNGHAVAVLSRGETSRASNAEVSTIQADRYGDLSVLAGEDFDWVFDSCAYSPDAVEKLLNAVGSEISRYLMISSISAYDTFLKPGMSENDSVLDATTHDLEIAANVSPKDRVSAFAYGESYGPLKRACEIKADQMLGERATVLRVGLLVGPGDYTDRLTWWVRRFDEATQDRPNIPAPLPKDRPVQLIDVRDVAEFTVNCAANSLSGIWNVTGDPMELSVVLDAISKVSNSDSKVIWVTEDAIKDAGIAPWSDIPLMAPMIPEFQYFLEVGTDKAKASGLKCRPIEETLRPLLDWDRSRRHQPLKVGMTPQQEELLVNS